LRAGQTVAPLVHLEVAGLADSMVLQWAGVLAELMAALMARQRAASMVELMVVWLAENWV